MGNRRQRARQHGRQLRLLPARFEQVLEVLLRNQRADGRRVLFEVRLQGGGQIGRAPVAGTQVGGQGIQRVGGSGGDRHVDVVGALGAQNETPLPPAVGAIEVGVVGEDYGKARFHQPL